MKAKKVNENFERGNLDLGRKRNMDRSLKVGGKWRLGFNLEEPFNLYEENEDVNEFREFLIKILEDRFPAVEENLEEYAVDEYQEIIDELEMIGPDAEESEVDYVLSMLFDWGDNYNVWISRYGK